MNDPLLWPILVYGGLVAVIVGFMIGFSYVLGQRHKERETGDPYESGIRITGTAHLRFPAHFYIVAMFFLIFDLEVIFIVAWAIAFRDLGWMGYIGILVFIGILLLVLIYEWRIGALDYATSGKKIAKLYKDINQKKK
jgi:NADH-quinone oxidoreductase subunit A